MCFPREAVFMMVKAGTLNAQELPEIALFLFFFSLVEGTFHVVLSCTGYVMLLQHGITRCD